MLKTFKHHAGRLFPALTQRNYRIFFTGQVISVTGTWMQITAEQWLIYPILTQSKILLGVVGAVSNLPMLLLVLFAGVYVDRLNKKKILLITQTIFLFSALLLSYLIWTNHITITLVIVFSLFTGLAFAFDMPTRQAFIAETVEKENIGNAISLNSGAWNLARMIAPPLAGFLMAGVGIAVCYFLNALSFLAVIISLFFIKTTFFHNVSEEKSVYYHLKEGFLYIKNHPSITNHLFALGTFTVFTFSFTNLLPVFTHDIFHSGEQIFGLLGSAIGVGATVGAFTFALIFKPQQTDKIKFYSRLIIMGVLSVITFALSSNLFVSFAALIIAGYTASVLLTAINTTIQYEIPNEIRGRIMSYYSLVFIGSMPVGSLYAGITAHFIGAPLTVILGAVFSFILILFFFIKKLPKLTNPVSSRAIASSDI